MPQPSPRTAPQDQPRRRDRALLRRLLAGGCVLVLLGGAAACGGDDPEASPSPSPTTDSPSASPSESPSETAEESPTESASPSETASPTGTPSSDEGSDPGAGTLRDALLSADELPGLNAESSWTQGRTSQVGTAPFGWCQRYDALTVGAREGVQRQFRDGDSRAGQQVLDLVDETNAVRAERVFRSWHQQCRRGNGVAVRPISDLTADVSGDADSAWWYLSSTGRRGGQWEAFGLARSGQRITLLRMQHAGQDHSYPPGEDPLEVGLRTAAGKLG